MEPIKPKIRFDISGYYFIGLFALVLLGFWPSYFAKFFNGTADFNFYFHFHSAMVTLWIFMLIAQPILIRKKKLALHRLIGKLSYVVFPLIFISVILLVHSRHNIDEENLDIRLFVPFKDLIILGTAYFIAIKYRHDINLHARAMVATGVVFIEPALVRFIMNTFGESLTAYLFTIGIIYALLIVLIVIERHQKRGRWIFPLVLVLYLLVHSVIIFNIHMGIWEAFSKWFIVLPLT
ncbi:hypothetical protein [Ferruginibacter sp.]|nr:hypothetical protein [Ferruginibacter sp.]